MITLKFPGLEKFVTSKSEDLKTYEKGVIVSSQHAIVVGQHSIIICNLYDYFVNKEKIKDQKQVEKMNKILSWMDGKIFPESYWKDLTKGYAIEIEMNDIILSDHETKKKLIYQDCDFAFQQLLNVFKKEEKKKDSIATERIAFDINTIEAIKKNCNVKNDSMILSLKGTESRFYHFSFKSNAHIFGLLSAFQEDCQEAIVNSEENMFSFFNSLF